MSAYSQCCPKCLDPIAPDAATVEVNLPTGEMRAVHPECAALVSTIVEKKPESLTTTVVNPPAPKGRLVGWERGR